MPLAPFLHAALFLRPDRAYRSKDKQMGAFASVPDDCLDKASDWFAKEDFLCQRAVSRLARHAARRGIMRKVPRKLGRKYPPGWGQNLRVVRFDSTQVRPPPATPLEMTAPPRAVEAMGRVFGPGCTNLSACGVSVQSIAALHSFVTSTNGGLLALHLRNCAVSPDALFLMCRASPNLLYLRGPRFVSTPDAAIAAIGEACPKLQSVDFSTLGSPLGPAERWGRVFPRLQSLVVCPEDHDDLPADAYQPTRIDYIAEAARISSAVELDVDGCIISTEFVAAIVGTPVGDRLTQFGHGYRDTVIEPEALLAAVRGFPNLTELCIPQGTTIPSLRFMEDLARSRNFESIFIGADGVTNAHVLACLRNNSLKKLELIWCHDITRDLLDDMISTQAATLEDLNITYCAEDSPHDDDLNRPHGITFSALLRLVQACPKLKRFHWQHEETAPLARRTEDIAMNNQMLEILRGRGGHFHHEWR